MATRRLFGLGATALLAATTVIWGTGAANAVAPTTSSLTAELERASGGKAKIALRPETGAATFAGGSVDSPLQPALGGDPSVAARRFIDHYGPMFGVAKPATDLTELSTFETGSHVTAVRFQQRYQGVPVLAGEIAVQIGSSGSVLSTSGEALPEVDVEVNAEVPAAEAADTARSLVAKYDGASAGLLTTSTPELWIYDPSMIGADGPAGARLVWRMDVRTELGDVNRLVLIDAHTGAVALQFNQREDALSRAVCNNNNDPNLSETCSSPVTIPAVGPGSADVNAAFELSGVTYDFYFDSFGRDSVNGAGLQLKSTVRYCPTASDCPYIGAFWNGDQMVYGEGFAIADDVVGHELTHGVTQYTSDLLYYAESGAINESMSDVMGELIDLWNDPDASGDKWLLGEDLAIGEIRDMENPPVFGDPDRMKSPLYFGGSQDSHGVHTNSGVNNKAAFLITDGGSFNGQSIAGLGGAKAAQIYYEANSTLLGPGSDYLDLFNILPQACTNVIGTAGITAADCLEVTKAVTATEMNQFPTTAGAHLSAPVCDGENVLRTTLFTDNMEVNNSNWTSGSTPPGGEWSYFSGSSQSGTRSLFAPDRDVISTSTLQGAFNIAVTSGFTYLRFDHSFQLEAESGSFYDGGVVEYSVNGGASWIDAGALPTINGYNGVLESGFGNPLPNRSAFSGPSPGYQTTRINLSSLAGSSVRFRFRLSSDVGNFFGATGWFIDDVKFYTCGLPGPPMKSLVPARLLESRPDLSTIDGQFNGIGVRGAGSVTVLPVVGRGGVGGDAAAVVLNVTVTDAQAAGFVTVYPCGAARPTASNLNYVAGSTVANAVIVKVGDGGQVCLFTQSATNLVVDVAGYFPVGSSLSSLVPARLLESRPDLSTIDGQFNGIGVRGAGSVTVLPVVGRGGVGGDAAAVVLNVTVTDAQAAGFVTVYPCGAARPTASNLNYVAGSTVANAVIVKVGDGGQVCLFTQSATNLVVDVAGYFPVGSSLSSLVPARLLESRPDLSTIDGQFNGIGVRGAGSVTVLPVVGRGGVGGDAAAVVLNVTVTDAQAAGFVTVYPCGAARPTASNLNYVAGSTVANAVIVKVGDGGQVCLFTQSATNLVVDVAGYFPP